MREKLLLYQFSDMWLNGKANAIANALSRHPVDCEDDDKPYPIRSCIVSGSEITSNLKNNASKCQKYQSIKEALHTGKLVQNLPSLHPAKCLGNVWHWLTISDDDIILLDANCIFVPKPSRKEILQLLHKSHCGITKTLALARKFYFWPTLKNDVSNLINSCEKCQCLRPKLPDDVQINTAAAKPVEKLSIDLFEIKNKHYFLIVDRFSGLPWFQAIKNLSTETITKYLLKIFQTYGYPRSIQSDGGPQFRGRFKTFCNELGIIHEASSPYNPHSNAQAESTIKSIKYLISKCNHSDLDAAFASWKNTPRQNSPSPNTLFFGRNLRLDLPIVDSHQPLTKTIHDPSKDKLHPLKINSRVWVQNPSRYWNKKGTILSINDLHRM